MKKHIIYLTGFMGAGKSTIGPILANTLGWDFYDLDKVIENKYGQKIRDIFEQSGEDFFRKIETEELITLSKRKRIVVSLGGGTIANDLNFNILKATGSIIYLKASPEVVSARLLHKRDRPSLKVNEKEDFSREEFLSRIKSLYDARKEYYEQADLIIDTDRYSVGKTVDRIADIIRKEQKNNPVV
jgi:shikimate kinase